MRKLRHREICCIVPFLMNCHWSPSDWRIKSKQLVKAASPTSYLFFLFYCPAFSLYTFPSATLMNDHSWNSPELPTSLDIPHYDTAPQNILQRPDYPFPHPTQKAQLILHEPAQMSPPPSLPWPLWQSLLLWPHRSLFITADHLSHLFTGVMLHDFLSSQRTGNIFSPLLCNPSSQHGVSSWSMFTEWINELQKLMFIDFQPQW